GGWLYCCCLCNGRSRHERSFPTRRSSDLVMALVDDHVPVGGDEVVHFVTANETLDDGNVQASIGLALPSTDLADLAGLEIEKQGDRKSTRLNSSHVKISYAVFCLKKKTVG